MAALLSPGRTLGRRGECVRVYGGTQSTNATNPKLPS
jgi:hypothetical protein